MARRRKGGADTWAAFADGGIGKKKRCGTSPRGPRLRFFSNIVGHEGRTRTREGGSRATSEKSKQRDSQISTGNFFITDEGRKFSWPQYVWAENFVRLLGSLLAAVTFSTNGTA